MPTGAHVLVQMRRKPLFYVFNMILPCLLITLVALLGFYIPNDSGEKVSMGITTLLSMTVFLMLVTESMPPTSDVLPLVGQSRRRGHLFSVYRMTINQSCLFMVALCNRETIYIFSTIFYHGPRACDRNKLIEQTEPFGQSLVDAVLSRVHTEPGTATQK